MLGSSERSSFGSVFLRTRLTQEGAPKPVNVDDGLWKFLAEVAEDWWGDLWAESSHRHFHMTDDPSTKRLTPTLILMILNGLMVPAGACVQWMMAIFLLPGTCGALWTICDILDLRGCCNGNPCFAGLIQVYMIIRTHITMHSIYIQLYTHIFTCYITPNLNLNMILHECPFFGELMVAFHHHHHHHHHQAHHQAHCSGLDGDNCRQLADTTVPVEVTATAVAEMVAAMMWRKDLVARKW